jgi:hypothetical protein
VPGLQESLAYTFPDPARVTSASLAPIGLGRAEASAIAALAAGREIPEVSDFVAFRLGQRDAFPLADPSLQAALAHLGLRAPVANWRPWLALAAAHLMAYGDALVRTAKIWHVPDVAAAGLRTPSAANARSGELGQAQRRVRWPCRRV